MYLQQLQQQQYLLGGCDVLRTTHFGDEHVMTPIHEPGVVGRTMESASAPNRLRTGQRVRLFALNSIVYNDMMATIVNWEDSSAR